MSSSRSHQAALVGGRAELSCQLSPPQSAEHMQVGWFQEYYSQLVYLYKDGEEDAQGKPPSYVSRFSPARLCSHADSSQKPFVYLYLEVRASSSLPVP